MKAISLCVSLLAALPAAAQNFTVDSSHTYPSFEVSQFGFFGGSVVRGKFDKTTGKATLDRAAKKGSVEVAIEIASVDTGNARLNERLRSPDLFDAAKFPTMKFKSDDFKFDGDKITSVTGQLTVRDMTKPVTLTVGSFHCGPHPVTRKEACGIEAATSIKCSDYGIEYGLPGVHEDVKITIEMEGLSE